MPFSPLPSSGAGSATAGRVVRAAWGEQVRLNFDDHEDRLNDLETSSAIEWRGAWSSATTYAIDDMVEHDGSSYIATAANSNNEPGVGSPDVWDLVAQKGDDGGVVGSWEGEWGAASDYAAGDVVEHNGSSWRLSEVVSPPDEPGVGSPNSWELVAAAGDARLTPVIKTADEPVISSTVLQNDNELFFSVEANTKYAVKFVLLYTGATAGDFKVNVTVPAGAAYRLGVFGLTETATGVTGPFQTSTITEASGSYTFGCSGFSAMATLDGVITIGATAGTVQFQFAQGTSSGTATTVLTHSYVTAIEIS